MKKMRRVVVTGVGLVSPLGCGSESVWSRIYSGRGGIVSFNSDGESSRAREEAIRMGAECDIHIGGFVPRGEDQDSFDAKKIFGRNVDKEMAVFSQYAVHASDIAMKHAKLTPTDPSSSSSSPPHAVDPLRFGVSIASGIGAIEDILDAGKAVEKSHRRLSPYFVPKILLNMAGK